MHASALAAPAIRSRRNSRYGPCDACAARYHRQVKDESRDERGRACCHVPSTTHSVTRPGCRAAQRACCAAGVLPGDGHKKRDGRAAASAWNESRSSGCKRTCRAQRQQITLSATHCWDYAKSAGAAGSCVHGRRAGACTRSGGKRAQLSDTPFASTPGRARRFSVGLHRFRRKQREQMRGVGRVHCAARRSWERPQHARSWVDPMCQAAPRCCRRATQQATG